MNEKIDMSNFNPENDVNQNSPTTIARKLSSFGKAMTGLSDGSFLPNLQMPFSRTSISTVKDDTMCSTCGNQESRSSLYHNKSEHLNDTPDQARLIKNSITSESEPKKHWIHQMLAKTSSSSLLQNHSNLTARPSRRTSYSTNATSGLRSEKPGAENEHKKKDSLMESSFEDEKNLMDQQQTSPEPVTRMIQDLEGLLKEALVIARQATDSEVHELDPARETYDINHGASYPNDAELDYSSDDSSNVSDSSSLRSEERDLQEDRITVVEPYSRFQDTKQSLQAWDIKSCPVSSISVIRKRSAVSIPSDKNITLKSVHVPNMDEGMATKPGRISGPTLQPVAKDIANDSESLTEAPYPKDISRSIKTNDWALVEKSSPILKSQILMSKTFKFPRKPDNLQNPSKEQHEFVIRKHRPSSVTTARTTIHQHAKPQGPHIQPRSSSAHLRLSNPHVVNYQFPKLPVSDEGYDDVPMAILHPSEPQRRTETQHTTGNRTNRGYSFSPSLDRPYEAELSSLPEHGNGVHEARPQYQGGSLKRHFSLTGRRHLSFRESHGFSLSRSHRRSPIARDWRTPRKRYVATVACISTALMGLIIGIYAGEVPAIQYAIVDEHHYTILGNVVFFIGMAITTALFWPLPLLHGRKSYTIAALALLLPLQFPQALAVNQQRSPDIVTHRVGLLLSRSLSGLVMGFANINFKTTLLDLFGASLQSAHPHQETVSNNDVRRHGGGMGVWLGIWVWCSIGSIGVGFLIGAVLISGLDVVWGFWLTIILIAFTLILNVLVPEVRRSHHRRSMAEIQQGDGVSRRIARGEIKMHLDMTGPKWWWEEVVAGHRLCLRMLKQPGFTILSTYMGWIYGQIVMVIVVCDPRIFFLLVTSDTFAAFRSPNVQTLPLSSTIRGSLRRRGAFGRFACNPFSKSFSV